jgi:hypothetical protein
MCCDCAIQRMLNDPLIRLVMESDGVGEAEVLSALNAAALGYPGLGHQGVPEQNSWWMTPRAAPRGP